MPQHDAYARYTPYELAIPGRDFADHHVAAIIEEAEARDVDLDSPGVVVMLGTAGQALREIRGPSDDPELIDQYGLLLYHAVHFHRAGEPIYVMSIRVARFLVEAGPETEGWSCRPPHAAGYVQLPRHLFWAEPLEEGPAEAVDGFFWTASEQGALNVLLVLGMRGDRPGMSVVPLPSVTLEEAGSWATEVVREAGDDFTSTLPGGELDRLYSFEMAGEVLKLVARTFWYLEAHEDAALEEEGRGVWGEPGDSPDAPTPSEGPRPSSLSFVRMVLP